MSNARIVLSFCSFLVLFVSYQLFLRQNMPRVLRHYWLGVRKGIWPAENWVLVHWQQLFGWSFACLKKVVTVAASIVSCCSKVQNYLTLQYRLTRLSWKLAVKKKVIVVLMEYSLSSVIRCWLFS